MPCMGRDTCFPLAFGVPAGLMVVSICFFLLGTRWYTRYPPKENVMLEVLKVMKSALSNRRFFDVKREHWLDHHLDNHSCTGDLKCKEYCKMQMARGRTDTCFQAQFVADIKAFLRVSVMYLPVPVFWALFDLQGSRWVLQGVDMDGRLWDGAVLLPDQIPTVNPILIMLFIPIFQGIVYPTVKKCGINPTPLRKMTVGGLLAAASFIVAMFVQIAVQKTLPNLPASNEVHLAFINTHNCVANVTPISSINGVTGVTSVQNNSVIKLEKIMLGKKESTKFYWNVTGSCFKDTTITTNVTASKSWYTVLVDNRFGTYEANLEKPTTGEGQFKMSVQWYVPGSNYKNQQFLFCRPKNNDYEHPCIPGNDDRLQPIKITSFETSSGKDSAYVELKPGHWELYLVNNTNENLWKKRTSTKEELAKYLQASNVSFTIDGQGGIYTLTVGNSTQFLYTIVPYNKVNLLLQIPQYVVVTAGEILFSITGLEFSYSQAPNSMKSVIQAVWLLTVAGGDLIDLIIAELRIFPNHLEWELLLYAGLMAVVIIIFALMAQFWYVYVQYTRDDEGAEDAETAT